MRIVCFEVGITVCFCLHSVQVSMKQVLCFDQFGFDLLVWLNTN